MIIHNLLHSVTDSAWVQDHYVSACVCVWCVCVCVREKESERQERDSSHWFRWIGLHRKAKNSNTHCIPIYFYYFTYFILAFEPHTLMEPTHNSVHTPVHKWTRCDLNQTAHHTQHRSKAAYLTWDNNETGTLILLWSVQRLRNTIVKPFEAILILGTAFPIIQ